MGGGSCQKSGCSVGIPQGGVVGYKSVDQSEQALMSALNRQPVSIAVEADRSVFQSYSSGIMSGMCGTSLDHGILAVGYGTETGGSSYWLVKNSWGTSWGMQGFAKLLRGKNSAGECGILMQASYPLVSGSPGPAPSPSPGPSPGPAPGCADAEDFCTDPSVFNPSTDCSILASYCQETCGCCASSPPSFCNSLTRSVVVV